MILDLLQPISDIQVNLRLLEMVPNDYPYPKNMGFDTKTMSLASGLEKVILCLPAYAKVSNFTPSSGVKWVNCLHKPTNLTPIRGIKNKVTPNNYHSSPALQTK